MLNKKKNGAHTHVRTTVQLREHNIHVGCCLFSHVPNPTKQKHTNKVWLTLNLKVCMLVCWNKLEKKEKKTEHTRMHAQLCSSRAQYSRRLLSILAQ